MASTSPRRVIVMGAAGRDFHNFLVSMRNDPGIQVVAFTATQIPGIDDRVFPAALAGDSYPDGIPVFPETRLAELIAELAADEVVFAYSDIAHTDLMHHASLVLAAGADFRLMGPARTMLPSNKPVISVCAVRTGVGKSGISKRVFERLRHHGVTAVDVRHPMPYRDLTTMAIERYATIEDLDRLGVTVEEREEYEPLLEIGGIVMAGVDYEGILKAAEAEADVIVWDGGNNDWPFYKSDLEIVAVDPHRLGHERSYYPGEVNFLRADVIAVNKIDTADPDQVEALIETIGRYNPEATVVRTNFELIIDNPELIRGKTVLAVEDGPTVTHGGMAYGAAALAAEKAGAAGFVDPTPYAAGSLKDTFAAYPHMKRVLPAMGYSATQLADLAATIEASPADVVVIGTPIDLGRLIEISKPCVRVRYRIEDAGVPSLDDVIDGFLRERGLLG